MRVLDTPLTESLIIGAAIGAAAVRDAAGGGNSICRLHPSGDGPNY